MTKQRSFHIILFLLMVMGSIVIAEGIFRVYHAGKKRARYIYVPDYHLGYVLSGNNSFRWPAAPDHPEFETYHQTNPWGMINGEILSRKSADSFRILVMGDSFTEAMQVERKENFCSLLQSDLIQDAHSGWYFSVLNAGTRGYSPINHYLRFKRQLAATKPDVVIVQLFVNDVFEDYLSQSISLLDEEGLPVKINQYFRALLFLSSSLA